MSSYLGKNLHVSIFGQSHAPAIGVTVDGLPAGERVDLEELKSQLEAPEEVVEFDNAELNRLWVEIEKLPLQCKAVFKLVVLEDMKYREVAEALDISVNTVKTQVKIAYKTLRESLQREQFSLILLLYGRK